MQPDWKTYRILRRGPHSLAELAPLALRLLGLSPKLEEQRIYAAWDKVSGAARYTVRKYFRNGTLCCTLSSSVVRSSLCRRRSLLISLLNSELLADGLQEGGDGKAGPVKALVLN